MADITDLGSFRWLLGYYRHLSQLHFFAGEIGSVPEAYAGVLLARSLGDELFENRGLLEILLMSRKFRLSLNITPFLQKMKDYAAQSESDRSRWMECVIQDKEAPSYLLERMTAEARNSSFPSANVSLDSIPDLKRSLFFGSTIEKFRP